jgi:hypothetical protein
VRCGPETRKPVVALLLRESHASSSKREAKSPTLKSKAEMSSWHSIVTVPIHSGIKFLLEERNFVPIASILHGSFTVQSAALRLAHTRSLCISHGIDTIMTQYDTGRTKIPFGPLDVCIWVSPFIVQDSAIEGTPHQSPIRGLFAEQLNLCYNYH